MSGQYPPPNPAHPYNRLPHHQRAPPSQRHMPPWGHTAQSGIGSSMNFYSSPHMGLPSRGAQPWVPPQTHPKPSDSRPNATNPLFGLQMLMTPDSGQRIPSEYQQEETMDLSSHSSVPSITPDVPKIVSARSENNELLRNGAILPPEVNGDVVDRTVVSEAEVKDSIVTSVIAMNPLRENVVDAVNCSRTAENSVVKRVEASDLSGSTDKEVDVLRNSQSSTNTESSNMLMGRDSEPVNSVVSSVLKTLTTSIIDPVDKSELTGTDRLGASVIEDSMEKTEVKSVESIDVVSKSVGVFDSSSLTDDSTQKLNELQTSFLDSSSLSVDTDESKLVVAESSAEDIFGISPVDKSAPVSQEVGASKECNEIPSTLADMVPDKSSDTSPECLDSNDQYPKGVSSTVTPSTNNSEPQPSVENVEILLESMFNSQEDTSCSSQNSNSGVPQSVIVTSSSKTLVDVYRPQVDKIMPMKEEELAITLAEDNPEALGIKEEKKEEKFKDDFMDEIEKKLEMLTESSANEVPKFCSTIKDKTPITELIKEEDENIKDVKVVIESTSTSLSDKSEPPRTDQKDKPIEPILDTGLLAQKSEAGSSSNPFIEVETQLEKMFAGIMETSEEMGSDNQSQPSASEPKRPAVNKKTVTKRKKANSRRPSDNSVFGGCSSGESTPIKKKGRKRVNDSGSERGSKKLKMDNMDSLKKGKVLKDVNSDSLSSKVKGPFVHIEGSKESPASVVVVNSGLRADDEDGVDKASARRKHSKMQRTEGSTRKAGSGSGYSSSTLSMRYNSDTADLSWVCVFCKRGPHCEGGLGGEPAGDLFGPYRVPATPPGEDAVPPGMPADKDVVEEQKKRGGKYPKSLRACGGVDHLVQKLAKKSKRSMSSESSDAGPGLLPVDEGYEVWLHGTCAEWAPGLCIIGSQLVGLDDAVWTATRTKCSQCGENGAGIGCVIRNCPARMHYPCAVLCGWLLDSETFIARCHTHRTRLRPS